MSTITGAEMRAMFDRVSNWGRWGADDERGTLNYLTPERIAAAGQLVKSGTQVSCARDFPVMPGPENPTPALHHIVMGGDDPCGHGVPGLEVSLDFIGIAYHGLASSHIDALCHVFVDGKMYNGHPATDVRSTGARRNSIMAARDGIVGRCVLLDVPRLRGEKFVALDRRDKVPGGIVGLAFSLGIADDRWSERQRAKCIREEWRQRVIQQPVPERHLNPCSELIALFENDGFTVRAGDPESPIAGRRT